MYIHILQFECLEDSSLVFERGHAWQMLGTFVSFLCEILALHLPCTSSCRLEEADQSLKTASKPETDKERYLERSLDSTSKASIEGEGADSKEIQGKTSTDSRGSGSESPSNSSVSRQKAIVTCWLNQFALCFHLWLLDQLEAEHRGSWQPLWLHDQDSGDSSKSSSTSPSTSSASKVWGHGNSQHGLPAMAKVFPFLAISILYIHTVTYITITTVRFNMAAETCHIVEVSETNKLAESNEDLEAPREESFGSCAKHVICIIDSNLQTEVAQICLVSLFLVKINCMCFRTETWKKSCFEVIP